MEKIGEILYDVSVAVLGIAYPLAIIGFIFVAVILFFIGRKRNAEHAEMIRLENEVYESDNPVEDAGELAWSLLEDTNPETAYGGDWYHAIDFATDKYFSSSSQEDWDAVAERLKSRLECTDDQWVTMFEERLEGGVDVDHDHVREYITQWKSKQVITDSE